MRMLSSSRYGASAYPIVGAATLFAIGLMAWDHLWGNEPGVNDAFPVDSPTFFLALGLIAIAGLVVSLVSVPRASQDLQTARWALLHSGVALLPALPASWLGFPAVVAAGGIALGVQSFNSGHRRLAILAIVVGAFVVLFAIAATAFPRADTD